MKRKMVDGLEVELFDSLDEFIRHRPDSMKAKYFKQRIAECQEAVWKLAKEQSCIIGLVYILVEPYDDYVSLEGRNGYFLLDYTDVSAYVRGSYNDETGMVNFQVK